MPERKKAPEAQVSEATEMIADRRERALKDVVKILLKPEALTANDIKLLSGNVALLQALEFYVAAPMSTPVEYKSSWTERVRDEIADSKYYLEKATSERSREYLSMAKDESRHAGILINHQQRKAHELTDIEMAELKALQIEYQVLLEELRKTIV